MNAVHVKRLKKLADFLDKLPRQKFDFSVVAHVGEKPMLEALKAGSQKCGTVACALGWTPAVFPRSMKWKKTRWSPKALEVELHRRDGSVVDQTFDAAGEFFGIGSDVAGKLFDPSNRDNPLGADATAKQVAKHIRKFITTQQRSEGAKKGGRSVSHRVGVGR